MYTHTIKKQICLYYPLYMRVYNTLIEALSFGVPIISTDCKTGPREILNKKNLENYLELVIIKNYQI